MALGGAYGKYRFNQELEAHRTGITYLAEGMAAEISVSDENEVILKRAGIDSETFETIQEMILNVSTAAFAAGCRLGASTNQVTMACDSLIKGYKELAKAQDNFMKQAFAKEGSTLLEALRALAGTGALFVT